MGGKFFDWQHERREVTPGRRTKVYPEPIRPMPLPRSLQQRDQEAQEVEPPKRDLEVGEVTPPGAEAHVPKWKIAVATFLGVLPTATVLDQLLGPRIAGWPYLAGQAAFAASMVTILTWAVMPLATRALGGWLRPQSRVEGDAR